MMANQLVGLPIEGELPTVRECLLDGQEILLGTISIRVIHTPGHTPGGVCFWIESENCLFTGDALFRCSVGRSDFPGGNMMQEINSVRNRLFTLPPETRVLTGHGPETNIGWEIKNNPYV